jgi:hypothetical protein
LVKVLEAHFDTYSFRGFSKTFDILPKRQMPPPCALTFISIDSRICTHTQQSAAPFAAFLNYGEKNAADECAIDANPCWRAFVAREHIFANGW